MCEEEKRKEVAMWLVRQGYEIEFDKDGFWMEDYGFGEHKVKEVIDLMINWAEHKKQQK